MKLHKVQIKIQIQLRNGQASFWYACTMCDEINNVQDATRNKSDKTILKISEIISEIENPFFKISTTYLVQLKLEYWKILSSFIASHIHMQKRNCCKMVWKYPIKFLLHLLENVP